MLSSKMTGQEMIEKFIQPIYVPWIGARTFHWIPYDKFEIEKDENGKDKILGEGGFGKTYKAILKWSEGEVRKVVLKILNDSQNITLFLREIANNRLVSGLFTVHYYGISQNPDGNYIMVMDYMEGGNLRQFLQENKGLSIKYKLKQWESVAMGLSVIHGQNLIHRDLHSGNILLGYNTLWNPRLNNFKAFISDLGLCQPASSQKEEEEEAKSETAFGVPFYIAPEVLQGKPRTQKSDIYSLGIIMYEWFANYCPYYDQNLGWQWIRKKIIEEDLRPSIDKVKIPQLLKDLIKSCWNADPAKRPTAEQVWKTIWNWNIEIDCAEVKDSEFTRQLRELESVSLISKYLL